VKVTGGPRQGHGGDAGEAPCDALEEGQRPDGVDHRAQEEAEGESPEEEQGREEKDEVARRAK
jgi:hypothetical protein